MKTKRRANFRQSQKGKRWLALALAAFCLLPLLSARAANAPYDTRTPYVLGGMSKTKDAFLPLTTLEKFGEKDLRNPDDLAVSSEGFLYIADTGNARVLKSTLEGVLVQEIGTEVLKYPRGVFVTAQGQVYVADTRGKAVYLFGRDGALLQQFVRPESPLYGKDVDFNPVKVAADEHGNVYVISEGNSSGVIQFSRDGDFLGFVGANKTPLSLNEIIRRLLFSNQQQAQMKRNVPVAPVNLALDSRGLLYTVTQGGANDALKKFNMAGVNMFERTQVDTLVAGVCVSPEGNVYTVSSDGYIAEYTQDGELLYIFGGRDDGYNRIGLFVSAAGIAADKAGRLYVLDAERRSVTVLAPTEYADTVHSALLMYQNGQYVESREPWEQALAQDAMFSLAYRGIGEAYYKLGQYDKAQQAFLQGRHYTGYSEAFWETRNAWLMDNLAVILVILLALYLISKMGGLVLKKTGWGLPIQRAAGRVMAVPLIHQVAYLRRLPRNPAEAFYGIRFERKVSVWSATVVYVLFFLCFLLSKYATAFLFKSIPDGRFEIGRDFVTVFGVLGLAVITNNLISSIQDGEARLRDVYNALAYCLMPYIFIKPFLVLISHVLTRNEAFLLGLGDFIIVASIAVLIVVMVREIQAYTYKKTFWNLLLTVLTMALIVVTLAIAFILLNQVVDFVSSIIREVRFRAG